MAAVDIHERMTAAVRVDESSDCHLWTRALNSRGYGVIWYDGRLHLAHRVAWRLANGRWPADDRVIDHLCEVKSCVNVAHLRELPNHLNLRRAYLRGDAATETRRAQWRRSNAKRRGTYRYVEGGG